MAQDTQNLIALPSGFQLGEYRIERYLGSGGFGITYSAIDENLDQRVAIKEYLPKGLAMRGADGRVTVVTSEEEADFRWGLERFLDEARALARFDHPNIVGVKRFIEAHGTGYIVMEYVDGEPLSELLKRKSTLTEVEIREHVLPVAGGLGEVHAAGLLHRDIKPGNIVIRADGVPVLIDFGSARHETSAKSRSLTAVITPGYAPLEQYSSSIGDQRPTTDIYALGAVLYRCVTGDSPPDATDRALKDRLTPVAEAVGDVYSAVLLTAIDAALRMNPDERPRDIAAFLELASAGGIRRERPEGASAGYRATAQAVGVGSEGEPTNQSAIHSSLAVISTNIGNPAGRAVKSAVMISGVGTFAVVIALAILANLDGGKPPARESNLAPILSTERTPPDEPPNNDSPADENEHAIADAFDTALAARNRGDYEYALREFTRLAEQGLASAQAMLGFMYDNGEGVAEDAPQAAQWYTRAAEQGVAAAQDMLGRMYLSGRGVPQDDAQAVHWISSAAEQGLANAQAMLGFMYRNGEGVAADAALAAQWYTRAAEQGVAEAQFFLANAYAYGEGVPENPALAVQWFSRAAEQGLAAAQWLLGQMYLNGWDVPEDPALAGQWLTRAAEQGDALAQNTLGRMYLSGRGVPQDDAQAVHWTSRAAEQGNANAQARLGAMYAQGRGVPRDDVQAYAWANLASAQGVEEAASLRDLIGESLLAQGSGLVAEAQALSRELEARIGDSQ